MIAATAGWRIRRSGEISILTRMAHTISTGLTRSLQEARDWMPERVAGEVSFKLRSEFSLRSMTPEEAKAVAEAVMGGLMAKSDGRRLFRLGRWIDPDRTDEQIEADIAKDMAGEMLPPALQGQPPAFGAPPPTGPAVRAPRAGGNGRGA